MTRVTMAILAMNDDIDADNVSRILSHSKVPQLPVIELISSISLATCQQASHANALASIRVFIEISAACCGLRPVQLVLCMHAHLR